ncbi:homoserine O-acetyltransferase [Frateuria sp. GZRR35]|uniref:homoserine O-acetyltransferase family protein n=1 Tax=unclassified Frateuria TaxID=2648894 RepID=UPI003EDC5E9A
MSGDDMVRPMPVLDIQPQSHTLRLRERFACEGGGWIDDLEVTFTTCGRLTPGRDNVVWVLHPLTCNANPMDWWGGMIGPQCAIDPARWFVVCVNALGSCYGTTGPASTEPATGRRYGRRFPLVTVRDVVAVHEAVRAHLGIEGIHLGVGGSYGGQQLLEWMATSPSLFDHACVIGASSRQSPWATAFNETQRMALEADASFFGDGERPGAAGLAAARALAVMSYRTAAVYQRTQAESHEQRPFDGLRAASYQRHIGERFVRRFDAHAYWTMTKAMDSHDVGRGRGSVGAALAAVDTRVLMIGLKDDLLFPCAEVAATAEALPRGSFARIDSDYGHDSILTHAAAIGERMAEFARLNASEGKGRNTMQRKQYA